MPIGFDQYFSDERIIRLVVRKRVASSQMTRRRRFLSNAAGDSQVTSDAPKLNLLPPRRHWPRPTHKQRNDPESDSQRALTSALTRYVTNSLKSGLDRFVWQKNLRALISVIRNRALYCSDWDLFSPKGIRVIPKVGNNYFEKCRVLTTYSLSDTILASCFASYLRDQIDDLLIPNCLAFRSPKNGRLPKHHDAVTVIQSYRRQFGRDQQLWVAECDIRGFFDAVSHDIVLREVAKLETELSSPLDPRFNSFLRNFLAGYSYTGYAYSRATNFLTRRGVREPQIPDPIADLTELKVDVSAYHGIPQGSAMSCILANIILSSADGRVMGIHNKTPNTGTGINPGMYIRYCDDIIIAHTDKSRCEKALKKYLAQLKRLQLPYHVPIRAGKYGAKFWKAKSKYPYLWGGSKDNCSDWLAFVGYQVHRNGTIRIRKASIEKEITKQAIAIRKICGRICASLKFRRPVIIPRGIFFRTKMHLISFGVGTPSPKYNAISENGVSWTKGFSAMFGNLDLHGVQRLDQSRNRLLNAQRSHVGQLLKRKLIDYSPRKPGVEIDRQEYGYNFSYYYQFAKSLIYPPPPLE